MSWTCAKCDNENPSLSLQCRKCGASKYILSWPPPTADAKVTDYKIDASKSDN